MDSQKFKEELEKVRKDKNLKELDALRKRSPLFAVFDDVLDAFLNGFDSSEISYALTQAGVPAKFVSPAKISGIFRNRLVQLYILSKITNVDDLQKLPYGEWMLNTVQGVGKVKYKASVVSPTQPTTLHPTPSVEVEANTTSKNVEPSKQPLHKDVVTTTPQVNNTTLSSETTPVSLYDFVTKCVDTLNSNDVTYAGVYVETLKYLVAIKVLRKVKGRLFLASKDCTVFVGHSVVVPISKESKIVDVDNKIANALHKTLVEM